MHWAALRNQAWRSQWPLILLCGLLLLVISEWTHLDWLVQDWIYDEKTRGFPLRDHWLLQQVLHEWVKRAVIVVWLSLLAIRIWGRGWTWVQACRRPLTYLLVSSASTAAMIAWMKHHTGKFCPWDLVRYGGDQPFVALLEHAENTTRVGQCWPGGHASTAFAFVGVYYALRACRKPWAGKALVAVLFLGGVLAAAQTLRGAHFLSHNLWTAWFSWLFAWLWALVFRLSWQEKF
jgi:membrane-associated PAP2 superfamily phosphatase